ncbi:MAG: hypothetical protein ABWZ16_02605 [Microbacterium sp.]
MSHRIAAVTIAAIALLGVTACTGSPTDASSAGTSRSTDQPGDEGQSKADACALILQSIEDATAAFENASSTDPAAAADAIAAAADRLAVTATQITNDEVAALVPSLQDMYAQVAEVMDGVTKGDLSRIGDVSQLGGRIQETSLAFQQICDA